VLVHCEGDTLLHIMCRSCVLPLFQMDVGNAISLHWKVKVKSTARRAMELLTRGYSQQWHVNLRHDM